MMRKIYLFICGVIISEYMQCGIKNLNNRFYIIANQCFIINFVSKLKSW